MSLMCAWWKIHILSWWWWWWWCIRYGGYHCTIIHIFHQVPIWEAALLWMNLCIMCIKYMCVSFYFNNCEPSLMGRTTSTVGEASEVHLLSCLSHSVRKWEIARMLLNILAHCTPHIAIIYHYASFHSLLATVRESNGGAYSECRSN